MVDLARSKSRVVQAGARTIPMPSRDLQIAKVVSAPTPAWRAENQNITAGKMQFDGVRLHARTLAVLATVPNELLEDAPNAGAILEENLTSELALELDRVALFGTGSAEEPKGLQNWTGINTRGSIGTPDNYDDFSLAVQDLMTANADGPFSVIYSPRTWGTLDRLKSSADDQPLQPPESYRELRKFQTSQVPDTLGGGSNESVAFVGDYAWLWIGVRKEIMIRLSEHVNFDKNQTTVRGLMRVDVAVVRPSFFTLMSGITAS